MAVIRINSNPYEKKIRYQRQADTGEWLNVDALNSPNSKLLSEDLSEGFFPFRARQIVDTIVEEYGIPGEPITIIFEGAGDEYQELKDACDSGAYEVEVIPQRGTLMLENARDILPEVKRLFKEMSPLILMSVDPDKIRQDLERFTDASSDVVPICVLGNYSAGKSTFINALIGSEILPSGAEPLTAKVYKIARSSYSDRAAIRFKYLGQDMAVLLTRTGSSIETVEPGNELELLLSKEIKSMEGESMPRRINHALSILNSYEDRTEDVVELSDLIEVEIPFANGVLAQTQHPFVIFDTPGSNSASNEKHLQILKGAMANMTNGLPIFLCTPDSLDSTDNENLYRIIREFKELDSRFTMIVVNKADAPGIQRRAASEQEEKRILAQAVPRHLYSGGLYYVSSILGLGAKTHGTFEDYDYEDVFAAQEVRYRDKSNRFYRSLYLFNILPRQIKGRANTLAAEQTDLIYANSGLFSVEDAVETFAGKYSAYNKCSQSLHFLDIVIGLTREAIEERKRREESVLGRLRESLDKDKKQLADKLEQTSTQEEKEDAEQYIPYMESFLPGDEGAFTTKELKEIEKEFTEQEEEAQGFKTLSEERSDAWKNVRNGVVTGLQQTVRGIFQSEARGQKPVDLNLEEAREKTAELRALRHSVDRAAAQSLLEYVRDTFERKLADHCRQLDEKSRSYWAEKTEKLRDQLAAIVSGTEVLTETQRTELENIIITYQQLSFPENAAEKIFVREDFQRKIAIGAWNIWQSDHLNLEELTKTYNQELKEYVGRQCEAIKKSHGESAATWLKSLLDEILTHIVEYSPELSRYAQQIRDQVNEIEELQSRQARLEQYTEELGGMMAWKEA